MNLNDPMAIADKDPSGVLYGLSIIPDACAEALALGALAGEKIGKPGRVNVVTDPPIIGEIIVSLVAPISDVPISRYGLKRDSAEDITLLLAIDGHGNSDVIREAVYSANPFGDAVVVVGAGGDPEIDVSDSAVRFSLPGQSAWSGAIPALFAAVGVLSSASIANSIGADAHDCIGLLRRQARAYAVPAWDDKNPAKQMALVLFQRLLYLLASNDTTKLISSYWRSRISRYAKVIAVEASFDEARAEMLGWRNAIKQSEQWSVALVRERDEPQSHVARLEALLDAVQDDIPIHELYADGDTRFVRVAGSMYFAEFVAAYLALLWGEDPADPAP